MKKTGWKCLSIFLFLMVLVSGLTGCGKNADEVADRMEKIVTGNNP